MQALVEAALSDAVVYLVTEGVTVDIDAMDAMDATDTDMVDMAEEEDERFMYKNRSLILN